MSASHRARQIDNGTQTIGTFTVDRDRLQVIVPAGEYWLTDPCYVVRDADWDAWLDAAHYKTERLLLAACTPDGHPVIGFSTQWGDGGYFDQTGREYGVDSGLIGLVPVAYNPTGSADGTPNPYLHRVIFRVPTVCEIDMDGLDFRQGRIHILRFGQIDIETGDGPPEVCEECGEETDCCECGEECGTCGYRQMDCHCEEDA